MPRPARYDAFVSYSHAADGMLAPRLRDGLQRFATPWRPLRWINPVRSLRVFLDQASLSANPALWPKIEQALASAEWFVLLASPEAARSPWVDKEADFWCRHKPLDNLLIVRTDGEIVWDSRGNDFDWTRTTALPERLAGRFAYEPRWIDAQWARTGAQATLRDPRFQDTVAELAAPLRGVPKDELIGEDIRQHRRLRVWRNAIVGVLMALLASAVIVAWIAIEQRGQALQNRSAALAALADMESEEGSATAVRVALAALPRTLLGARPYAAEAELALYRALSRIREVRRFVDQAAVSVASFSPDGRFVLVDSPDLRLLDATTGKQFAAAPKWQVAARGVEPSRVLSAAFSPDGRSIVTGGYLGSIRLWDAATLAPVTSPLEPERRTDDRSDALEKIGRVDAVAFSADGRTVASGSSDKTARIWDVPGSREIASLRHERGVLTVAFSPDGGSLLTACDDGARLWDVAAAQELRRFDHREWGLCCAALSPDGKTIATAAEEVDQRQTLTGVRLWETATGKEIRVLRGHDNTVTSVDFSPDGRFLVTTSRDATARIWNWNTGEQVLVLRDRGNPLLSASFGPDDRTLVTRTTNAVKLWDVAPTPTKELIVFTGHEGQINSASFDSDGHRIVTTSNDKSVRIWNAATGRQMMSLSGHEAGVGDADFSPDGARIVSASADHTARVWDAVTGKQIAALRGHTGGVGSAAFSPDGGKIVTSSVGDRTVRSWNESGAALGEPIAFPDAFPTEISAQGHVAVVTKTEEDMSGTCSFRNMETDEMLPSLHGPHDFIFCMLSPDQTMAVTVDGDERAQLWDASQGRVTADLEWRGRSGHVHDAAFASDGRSVAVAGPRSNVHLWDTTSGRELAVLRHKAEVFSVAFGPNGRMLLTAGADNMARIWPVLPRGQELIDFACARVPWPLAEGDRKRFGITEEWCTPEIAAELRAKLEKERDKHF